MAGVILIIVDGRPRRRAHLVDRVAHGRPRAHERRAVRDRPGRADPADGLRPGRARQRQPAGQRALPTTACGSGLAATATVTISYQDDPTPTSYATAANYKKVDRHGHPRPRRQAARTRRHLRRRRRRGRRSAASTTRSSTPRSSISATTSPTRARRCSSRTGRAPTAATRPTSSGLVSFAALTPNPTSGAQAYYDLTVTAASRLRDAAADVPPGTPTPPATSSHVQLAPSQTLPTTVIQIYKPATINLVLLDAGGSPYTGGAALKITSSFTGATTTDTVASGASSKTITMLGTNKVIPGATYTIEGWTTSGLCAVPAPLAGAGLRVSREHDRHVHAALHGLPDGNARRQREAARSQRLRRHGQCHRRPEQHDDHEPATTDASGNADFTRPRGHGLHGLRDEGPELTERGRGGHRRRHDERRARALAPPNGTLVVNVTSWATP